MGVDVHRDMDVFDDNLFDRLLDDLLDDDGPVDDDMLLDLDDLLDWLLDGIEDRAHHVLPLAGEISADGADQL